MSVHEHASLDPTVPYTSKLIKRETKCIYNLLQVIHINYQAPERVTLGPWMTSDAELRIFDLARRILSTTETVQ